MSPRICAVCDKGMTPTEPDHQVWVEDHWASAHQACAMDKSLYTRNSTKQNDT